MGRITGIDNDENGDLSASIGFSDGRSVDYGVEQLNMIEHAYAVTIHKSQGSEYDTVIIPILNAFYIMLKRNLIYTAVTRAKKKVILVGQKQALAIAIGTNDIDRRNTALADRIKRFYADLLKKSAC